MTKAHLRLYVKEASLKINGDVDQYTVYPFDLEQYFFRGFYF
tara:strand:+ start:113348 stop:113473 length:126 start_codon:yes stop_codon:yes gene_type:complete